MFKKIIQKLKNRYQEYYAEHLWRIIFDLGLLLAVIALLVLAQTILGYGDWLEIYYKSLVSEPIQRPILYEECPLTWEVSFSPQVVRDSTSRLMAEINYNNQADQPLQAIYTCREFQSSRQLIMEQIDNQSVIIDDNRLIVNIGAQQSGQLTIPVSNFSSKDIPSRQIKIICQLVAETINQSWPASEDQFSFKISGSASVTAGAYFYTLDGDQVGIGPVPPIVGLPTSYLVTWLLSNNGGDLANLHFSAQLGEDVQWQDQAGLTGGNLTYDQDTHQVHWRLEDWPDESIQKQASFYISISPTTEMVGTAPVLVKEGRWQVDDQWTGQQWQGSIPALTTNLDHDPRSKGQGIVEDWLTE